MLKILTILLVCSAVFARTRLQDTKTILAEMESDAFGSTMLSAIQMNAAAQGPAEEIIQLIEQILEQVVNDQAQADEKNRSDQAVCDETISQLNFQIVQTKERIAQLENDIKVNEEILVGAKVDLAQADKDYEETVNAIETGTAQRNAEHARWVEEDYANQISIATLEEGVKLINHMIHGVAFSQIKTRYEKVVDKLSDNQSKHATLFKPLISSLTQLATKLNYENVMKILDLLNKIRVSIVEERENARIAEEKAQADWEVLLNHLLSEKQRLSEKRARLRALIESTTQLLEQLRSSLESNRLQLENLQASLAQWEAWCAEQAAVYEHETADRTRETEILTRLLEHCRERYAAVSDYVASRTGAF